MELDASVQPVVAIEKVFYRERAAGMHSAFPYALDMYGVFYESFRIHS